MTRLLLDPRGAATLSVVALLALLAQACTAEQTQQCVERCQAFGISAQTCENGCSRAAEFFVDRSTW